ncbi:hypothetical protein [Anabaenopsis arnoldii]|uniref:hypothetical protein n=1 Tax=Anabaenopsis arnoldii TaxID=2152938 RepID=UPI00232F5535|nr:hypothetical protein [Anabaenopsis arnoldii]MDH6092375.1 hypothetical protein [Anabaenopsis arnoldii]
MVFWYLVLGDFTYTSMMRVEPNILIFQGAMPLGSGFFKWLNTLTTIIKIPQKPVS